MSPLEKAFDVPVLRVILPEKLYCPALGVLTKIAPDEVDDDDPDIIDTFPPSLEYEDPDVRVRSPAAPVKPDPTVTNIEPAFPL
jgi:hypothetical protein